jgi:hypothetical protein
MRPNMLLAFPSCLASCLLWPMGIGFCAGGTFAPPGLEGFRPAFLLSARTGFLGRQPAANEINYFERERAQCSL